MLTDQAGADTWPFVMTGYATIKPDTTNPQITKTLLHFFDGGLKRGQIDVVSVDLIPLPDSVADIIRASLRQLKAGN